MVFLPGPDELEQGKLFICLLFLRFSILNPAASGFHCRCRCYSYSADLMFDPDMVAHARFVLRVTCLYMYMLFRFSCIAVEI